MSDGMPTARRRFTQTHRRALGAGASIAIVVAVFVFFLPRIADYRDVLDVVRTLDWQSWAILAGAVLLKLHVHPGQPHHRPLERGAAGVPALVELRADPLDAGHEVATDLVHHVVAEPLEQAHHRLRLPEEPALLVAHQPLDPVLRGVLAGLAPHGAREKVYFGG